MGLLQMRQVEAFKVNMKKSYGTYSQKETRLLNIVSSSSKMLLFL